MMLPTLLAIDQGTTSTRAILFDRTGTALDMAQEELGQIYPHYGFPHGAWVEHDPEEIWRATLSTCRAVLSHPAGERVAAIGIANQRETTLLWDRATLRPLHNAIVWQDRRGADLCRALEEQGLGPLIRARTGLVLDSYFSATKLRWLLDAVPDARARAERGELAFGTIDSFLLARLTGGRVHATDATNAARTMLFDIHRQIWDDDLLEIFDIPRAVLPEVRDNAADFGATEAELFGRPIFIGAMAGDQHAALVGQACFAPDMAKSTYGTGCFMLANTGDKPVVSESRLLTTLAYRLDGKVSYALEGSVFNAGSAIKWLRDSLRLIGTAAQSEMLAASLPDNRGVYLVPAFTGLGAPHWDSEARGALYGLTRDTGIAEIARAALEAVAYQTLDLVEAMESDGMERPAVLRVDGGMAENSWLLQFMADILNAPVQRPQVIETTAWGVACLAGLQARIYGSLDEIASNWQPSRAFEPAMPADHRKRLLTGWRKAIERTRR